MADVNEIKLIQSQNEGLRKQNINLQQENKDLKMLFTKFFSELYQACNEPADTVAEVELQNKIKSVVDCFVSKVL